MFEWIQLVGLDHHCQAEPKGIGIESVEATIQTIGSHFQFVIRCINIGLN